MHLPSYVTYVTYDAFVWLTITVPRFIMLGSHAARITVIRAGKVLLNELSKKFKSYNVNDLIFVLVCDVRRLLLFYSNDERIFLL